MNHYLHQKKRHGASPGPKNWVLFFRAANHTSSFLTEQRKNTMPSFTRFTLPAVATAAALVLTGCGSSGFESAAQPEDTVYCVDKDNVVVDEAQCEAEANANGGNTHHSAGSSLLLWYMVGRFASGQRPGAKLDPAFSNHRVQTNDSVGRSAAGLSPTGAVKNGQSAGFGKSGTTSKSGSTPGKSGKPGGFGGSSGTGG